MRKNVLTLKEARPAIKNLIRTMKRKYSGRNINFGKISTVADDEITNNMPNKAKIILSKTKHVRKIGHDSGIEFYYYKAITDNKELEILPIIVFLITRNDNSGIESERILTCSLDTFLPRLVKEDIEIDELLDEIIKNRTL